MWRSRLHDAAPAGYRVPPRPVEAFPYPLPLSRESVAITSTFSREATIPRSSTFLREATGGGFLFRTCQEDCPSLLDTYGVRQEFGFCPSP